MGDMKFFELRDRMRRTLGTRFDMKDFHAFVLEPGAIPLPDLEWHVEREIERLIRNKNLLLSEQG